MHCSSKVIYSLAENLKYCGSTVQWKTLEVKIENEKRLSYSGHHCVENDPFE